MPNSNAVLTDQQLRLVSMITANLERVSGSLAATLPQDMHEAGAAIESLNEAIDYLKIVSDKQATFWYSDFPEELPPASQGFQPSNWLN